MFKKEKIKKMRKCIAFISILAIILSLSGCRFPSGRDASAAQDKKEEMERTGDQGNDSTAAMDAGISGTGAEAVETEEPDGQTGSAGQAGSQAPADEDETAEVPELTYKMALFSIGEDEYGRARAAYVVELDQAGFRFGYNMSVRDRKTGETLNYENDYSYEAFEGNICLTDKAHYDVLRSDGEFDAYNNDRKTFAFIIKHKGGLPAAEDIELVSEMDYFYMEAGEHTFTVNAKPEDFTVNTSKVLHGASVVRLKGQYFAMDPSSGAYGGGDAPGQSYKGWSYTFVPLTGDQVPAEKLAEHFSAVKWNPDTKTYDPVTESGGYKVDTRVNQEGGDLVVDVVVLFDETKDQPDFDDIEGLVPAWSDGDEKFVFGW